MGCLLKFSVLFAICGVLIYSIKQYVQGNICSSTARLDGKVAVITGANTGLGKETARVFVKRGAHVVMVCRSSDKCNSAARDILNMTGAPESQISFGQMDLSSFASVRKFADDFKTSHSKLDILMNNAGVMFTPYVQSEDGYELHIAVNHLGHFLLTVLLTDHLLAAAPSRVVTVSSLGHHFSSINLENLSPSEAEYNRISAYSHSKGANILFSAELGRRLQGTGVTTYSLHPGNIPTDLQRYVPLYNVDIIRTVGLFLASPFLKDIFHGAQTQICCAVDPALAKDSGKYYSEIKEAQPSSYAQSVENAQKLWKLSLEMTKLSDDEVHPKLL